MSRAGDPFALAGEVRLKPGRETPLLCHHPWVYRGALAGPLPPGPGPVAVRSAAGVSIGVALPGGSGGSLALRMVAWPGERWGSDYLRLRLTEAAVLRSRLGLDTDACRLVHAEGDYLPGLVIDRYAEDAVIEIFEPAWEAYLPLIARVLAGELGCRTVLLRRGGAGRKVSVLLGELPAGPVVIREGRWRLPADLAGGHKTGLYLDQRDNRRRLGALAGGCTVLNLFSYSGGFAVAALAGGAVRARNVDASPGALELARLAYRLNGPPAEEDDFIAGDAFQVARELAAAATRFDAVVVDPPSFVRRQTELPGGLRGLKDINLQALRLVAPGGLLLTCSCSALVSEEAFGGALFAAAQDARRELRLLERRGASPDHPVALACPETRHLQAWFCQAR
ncbi:MAG: class I SAM-dependent methyltransferase [Acidobacteriota bacterium]